jgi:uncharacterized repeat protein (TIGR03837 family)
LGDSRWVIFCRVIDNLGDAGVCWRLAQQLTQEFGKQIELVIDKPETLSQFGFNYAQTSRIKVTYWLADTVPEVGAVTISAFACELPTTYLQNMLSHFNQGKLLQKRYWFNLEYLSAQDWVESHHLLNSTKTIDANSFPADQKYNVCLSEAFYFPGFTSMTGGLIREQFIIHNKHQRQAHKRKQRQQFGINAESFAVSLFCYPNAPLTSLCNALLAYSKQRPVHLLLTAGLSLPAELVAGIPSHPNFKVQALPFLNQLDYDALLVACDLNFVRGEDSLVRAIWAQNPFIWQAYPQDQPTQHDKLKALLTHYFNLGSHKHFEALFFAWNFPNSVKPAEFEVNLQNALLNWSSWQMQSEQFCDRLSQQPDLATQLVAASV